jgi:asparagine synthase (glutamine-hydrolysing)
VRDFLEQGYVDHTDDTFFDGISKLPPAHSLVVDERGLRLSRYWELEPREVDGDSAHAVRELFLDAVRLRLRSDVPVGTCLSGGIDSSAIVCAVDHLLRTEAENARPVGDRQRTFTAFFDERGFDERPYAEAVVARTRSAPHWITFDSHELTDVLPSIVRTQDEPFGSTSIVAQWFVMRAAKQAGLKVMLDGQGADEILAGYHGYFGPFFADLLRGGRLRELGAELRAYRTLHGAGVGTAAVALARPFLPERVRWAARGRVRGGSALVHPDLPATAVEPVNGFDGGYLRRQMHLILTRRGLPELLHYEDRNSMAHSLEARVPFLDYRLVELLFSLGAGDLIERGKTKAVLRRALGDLLPEVVRDRVDKLGFVTPEAAWLRGDLGVLAADVFASREFRERGFVNAGAARRSLERHRTGERAAGFELWRALGVELWAREFL